MNIKKLNGRLPERGGNENRNEGWKIRMKENNKWSTTGISFGTNNVFSIYVNGMTEGVNSYISLFADVTEWLKQDIWMEKDMENVI